MKKYFKDLTIRSADRNARKEKVSYDEKVEKIVINNLRVDMWARIVLASIVVIFVGVNYCEILHFVSYQSELPINTRVPPFILGDYIKYGIALNSVLLAIVSYWFASRGASAILKDAMNHVFINKSKL